MATGAVFYIPFFIMNLRTKLLKPTAWMAVLLLSVIGLTAVLVYVDGGDFEANFKSNTFVILAVVVAAGILLYSAYGQVTQFVREFEQARGKASSAVQAKHEFIASLSHEVRARMMTILGYTELMLHGSGDGDAALDQDHVMKTIYENGEHLMLLIDDVTNISKLESAKVMVEAKPCSAIGVVAGVVDDLHNAAVEKGIKLESEFTGPIPSVIRTDPDLMRRVLYNLVDNAVRHTETGGVKIVTKLMAASSDKHAHLCVEVTDTGIGLSEKQQKHLFRPFGAATGNTGHQGSSGLGLRISKRLAEMLGGDITLSSKQGVGSSFFVTIETGPLDGVDMVDGAQQTVGQISQPDIQPQPDVSLTRRILIAEDDTGIQRLLAFVLRRAGAEVELASDGRHAVDKAQAAMREGNPFDAILMDMQMPVMDGYEATRLLRKAGYTHPIIALTAHALEEDRQNCLDAGCDVFVTKPVKKSLLLSILDRHTRSHDKGRSTSANPAA